jgi:hypothetical protein
MLTITPPMQYFKEDDSDRPESKREQKRSKNTHHNDVTSRAGTAYPSGAPEFIPGF